MVALTIKPYTTFQIRLDNDTLTMRGTPQESVGCVLRGQLVLVLTEATKVKAIKLVFEGKSKVTWMDRKDQAHVSDQRSVYHHEWNFIPFSKNTHTLTPGNYTWHFELVLPGSLPETVDQCNHGYIRYEMRAVVERPTFAFNLQTRKDITIQRITDPLSSEYFSSVVVTNTWVGKVEYEISIPRKAYLLGDEIPVEVTLKPLRNNLAVKRYVCVLKESITCKTKNDRSFHESRLVHMGRDDDFSCDGTTWTATEVFPIPRSLSYCLHDSQNDIIAISHKLLFYITFTDTETGALSELRAALPIVIIPNDDLENEMTLPKYNEQWLSEFEHENDRATTSTTFNLSDSRRLPSYQSALNCIPASLFESPPPAYDVCVNAPVLGQVH